MVCNVMLVNHLKKGLQCNMLSINYNVMYIITQKCYSIQISCFICFIVSGKVGEKRVC